ncbi:hypothetical protein BYT27DRAFT_7215892 [Phlegmacium glaucopus]|nr:hypothetical protein BYT27DRAFT_7215892 [Phlegmacium glaucopus]
MCHITCHMSQCNIHQFGEYSNMKKSTAATYTSSKATKSKAKKAHKVTEQLGTINNETEEITEKVKLLEEKQKAEEESQKLCQSFIKGQGNTGQGVCPPGLPI